MSTIRVVKAGQSDASKRQVWFDLRLESDGITPTLTEAGGQPQVSVAGASWTDTGIGTLTHVGNGRYYAVLTEASVVTPGVMIESRYKGALTAETPGDTISVEEFDLADIAAGQDEILEQFELTGGTLEAGSGGGVSAAYFGTLLEANNYFDNRLHESAWYGARPNDRPKALLAATRIINTLNYKGYKSPVYTLLLANPAATDAEIREQEASQRHEFPRGSDTEVPEDIRIACYEIAHSLLDGKDPELELENLGISSQGYESVRTTFSRSQVPIEHIINGVPNSSAWRLIRPFLRDEDAIKLARVS